MRYERFRQRVVRDAAGAHWCDDDDFDIRHHVVREKLVRKRGQSERAALQERTGALASEPLDPARPLWQFHLIEAYEGGSALVARVHHCIGDGIALISVMMTITDGGSDPPRRAAKAAGADDDGDWLADVVLKPLGGLSAKAAGLVEASIERSLALLANPQHGIAGAIAGARLGAKVMGDVAAMALMADDSPTLLKGKPSGVKRVAWGEPIALAEVKAIGHALGASINDVLLACVAGAIGDWLRAAGDDPAGKEIRAMVPVNLRPLDQAWQLGNRFGLAPLVLPIGIDNPVGRVAAVRARMNELKASYQPLLAFAVLAVAGQMVQPVQDAHPRPVREEGDGGDDQRPRPGGAAHVLRRDAAPDDVLGAGVGRHRRRRQHPVVRRRGPVRPRHRRGAVRRSAGDHRSLRARVREAAAGGLDAALGRGRSPSAGRIGQV